MSEYIAVQKGKLVSNSGKNRKKKKKKKKEIGGGCGGVFLQIFNGKRLFSWKSLPEGMQYIYIYARGEGERERFLPVSCLSSFMRHPLCLSCKFILLLFVLLKMKLISIRSTVGVDECKLGSS